VQFESDLDETVQLLYNCVSLGLWVPFNEGWGQFDSLRITERIRELDNTRPIDHASGWNDQGGGDLKSRHIYFRPVKLKNDGRRVLALTEFGGYSLPVPEHYTTDKEFGYRSYQDNATWMDALEKNHPVKSALYEALLQRANEIASLAEAEASLSQLAQLESVLDFKIRAIDLGTGTVSCVLTFPEALFYEILSSKTGMVIENDGQLLSILTNLAETKREYDKISDALSAVKATGYGIVMPGAEEMKLETPEILKKGSAFGVKLKAGAPSIHMIRVDIDTEISPMVGDEKQSRDLIGHLAGEDPEKLWQSNIFGKSVYDLIQEGLTTKLIRTPDDVRAKFRGCLSRVVNEGANGVICLII
jgi:stage IV sporulation protein A